MFKFRFLAAVMATMMLFGMSQAAHADRGKPSERVWMNGADQASVITELQTGSEVCTGSKRNHGCARINAFTGEALIQDVSRPIGANKNVVVNTIVALGQDGVVLRNEAGVVLARFQVGSENANWMSTLHTAFPAAIGGLTNGLGAAVVQAVANPCGNGDCGQGVVNLVTANAGSVSGSSSSSSLSAALEGGGCGSGVCTPRAPTNPNHTANGPGN